MTRLLLCVRAGGRCQFDGCPEYLFEHPLTLQQGNFAEIAHVVAFKNDGPRGNDADRPDDINDIDNLMLLCPRCHKLIDDRPEDHPKAQLLSMKLEHEDRIKHLTGLGRDRKTSVIVFQALIAGQPVSIPFDHIVEATLPWYPVTRYPLRIDLTEIPGDGPEFVKTACDTIGHRVARMFEPEGEALRTGHVSVFALGPMPLLICLGTHLSSKIPMDLYQRHRDKDRWMWKQDGPPMSYVTRVIKEGDPKRVAVVLSLSGSIKLESLPADVRDQATVYEMTLENVTPTPTFLRTRQDLEAFRIAYQELLGMIGQRHGSLGEVELFPAVPAPIAVLCGRELLPKVHPKLRVYDNDKQKGGFTYQLTV